MQQKTSSTSQSHDVLSAGEEVNESGNSIKIPFEPSDQIAAAPLESIVCTEELRNRPSRPPEYEKENRALAALASALADSPTTILQTLADRVLEMLHADSAGLSLLTKDGKKFYWAAVAGAWGPHVGAHAPRSFGPCGDVLDHNVPMLFAHWEQRYPYLSWAMPLADEGLLVPFYVNGKAVGTIWAVAHDNRRKFDAEDLRLLESMSRFASAAYQVVQSIESLKSEIAAREEAEAEVLKLASGLEAKVRRLVEANVVGILMFNLEGAITDANEAFLRMVQYSRDDLASGRVRWTDLTPAVWHPHNERASADLQATGVFQPFEKEYFRKDGSRVPVLLGGALFEASGNEGVAFVVDLTERKRAEAQLEGEKRLLEMVASGCALTDVLTELCEFVEETAADCKCGVYLIDWNGPHFRIGAVPSLPATFNDPCEGLTVSAAVGPCGVAALTKTQVIATDVESDPRWQSCAIRPLLLAHGFRSQWSTPIYSRDGRVLGTFAVFQHNPSSPTQLQLDLIAQVTHIASIAIERATNEAALQRSEADLLEAQRLTHTGHWKVDLASGIVTVSPEVLRIFDVTSEDDASQLEFWFTRVHPEDLQQVREHFERCLSEKRDYRADYRIVRPDDTVRYQHSFGRPIVNGSGDLIEFGGTIMDVTEQVLSRAELEKAFEEIKHLKDRLSDENLALKAEVDQASMFEEVVGTSAALRAVLSRLSKVSPTDSTVLLTGETGTGKELIARAIHKTSRRSSHAFVSVNCAAIPASLIASELFGHEKGAFTGAAGRRLGRFELAEEGTIFLDEVGELPAETQLTLLRVLQEREFERVGGNQPIRTNARVIAATNRDLEAAIATGTFRSDLFYRLNVFPIEIPPLRERREDIPLLVEYFVARFAKKAGKNIRNISKKTLDLFLSYPWPGNIRELQNVIERSVIVCETENFSVDESWLSRPPHAAQPRNHHALSQLVFQEREMIEVALSESEGRVSGPTGAAAKLGIPGSTLESKIRALRINKNRFKA